MYHLTLQDLIDRLEDFPDNELLYTAAGHILDGSLASYRGIYSDLSMGYHDENYYFDEPKITVGEFYSKLTYVIGDVMYGYKGGEFTMTQDTLCWLSRYNENSGLMIVGVEEIEGRVYLMTVMVEE